MQKRFGATVALSDGTFELRPGEIHALIGENGSGKSTLVKIVSGVHRPDGGTIELEGDEISLRTPQAAQRRGIATVFQEVLVAESRSVLENIWLGSDTWARRTPTKEKQARAASDDAFGRAKRAVAAFYGEQIVPEALGLEAAATAGAAGLYALSAEALAG